MRSGYDTIKLLIFLVLTGCSFKTAYEKLIENELKSGIRHDSLFLGIKLGMPEKAFLDRCWELNQQGILTQGSIDGRIAVLYQIAELKYPASMNFFPKYKNGLISNMEAVIKYNNWAPWNKNTHPDSLQLEIVRLFERWYGKGFIEVENKEKGTAFVKVDGNRRITIFSSKGSEVKVFYTDMMLEID